MRDRIGIGQGQSTPRAMGMGFVAMDYVRSDDGDFASAGGSCGNVMAILAWLGWRAAPVARLGDDGVGDWVRADLARVGVTTAHLASERNVSTPVVVQRFVSPTSGGRSHRFSTSCPDCGRWLPRYRPSTIQQADAAFGSFSPTEVFYFDRVSPAAVRLAGWARDQGALVLFEPSSRGDRRLFEQAVELCHILKFSTERLGDAPDLTRSQSPLAIVRTCGEAGLSARWRDSWLDLPAFPAPRLRDAAGSGDWCSAALLHGVAQQGAAGAEVVATSEFAAALRLGQALAALNCAFEGARGMMSAMTPDQVNDEIASFDLAAFEDSPRGAKAPTRRQAIADFCGHCPAKTAAC